MRQRNDTGGVLVAHELGRMIGPGEEFGCDLPVPGCTPVDEPTEDPPQGGGTPADDSKPPRKPPRGRGGRTGSDPDKETTE